MQLTTDLLNIFLHKMPMGIALFDTRLVLQRCNPTWTDYVRAHTPLENAAVHTGAKLFDLLPESEPILRPYLQRALAGETVEANRVRLVSDNEIFFWDVAFAPLIENGAVIGILHVATDATEREMTLQLLERRVADRTRRLSALYEVLSVSAEPLPLKETLNAALQRVVNAVRASGGVIHLLDESGKTLWLAVHQGLDDSLIDTIRTLNVEPGQFSRVLTGDQPAFLASLNRGRRALGAARRGPLTVYAGVPMNAKGKTIGMLSAFRESRRPFSNEDLNLLTSVADQIGTTVENARLRLENEKLLIVEERNRLARELHDAVTQSLYSLTLFAETGRRLVSSGQNEKAEQIISRIGDTAQQALREMRLLVHNLRPSALEKAGLVQALRQRLDAVEGRAGIQTRFLVDGDIALPPHVEEALYHIAQEALNNALKHAGATQVNLSLRQVGGSATLEVCDNGIGFDPTDQLVSGGLGLTSMRERVEMLHGRLSVDSVPVNPAQPGSASGTTVTVTLDLAQAGEPAGSLAISDLFGAPGAAT